MKQVLSVALLLVSGLAISHSQSAGKGRRFPAHPSILQPPSDAAASVSAVPVQPFVAPIVIDAPGVSNTLVLVNAASVGVTVTVKLTSLDGETEADKVIPIAAHEKRGVDFSEISSLGDHHWGSVQVLQQEGASGVLVTGQLVTTDTRFSNPAYIDEELSMPDPLGSGDLRAVTDLSDGLPLLALTNTATAPQTSRITCLRQQAAQVSQSVVIPSKATRVFSPCSGVGTPEQALSPALSTLPQSPEIYGLEISSNGDPGSTAAFALAPHNADGHTVYSAVPFSDPSTIHSHDLVFVGVPFGRQSVLPDGFYTPELSLANFGDTPLTIDLRLFSSTSAPIASSDPVPLPSPLHSFTVAPRSSMHYSFGSQEATNGLQHSILVTTDGALGQGSVKLVSRSTGSLFQVELLSKDGGDMNNTGVHPWSTKGDAASHLLLFNHTGSKKKIGLYIFSQGLPTYSEEQYLSGYETREVDLHELMGSKTGDSPTSRAQEGVVSWMTPESGDITGRLMVASRSSRMARNYSCGSYTGSCALYFSDFSDFIALGDQYGLYGGSTELCLFNPEKQANCQNGSPTTGTVNYSWTVDDTSKIVINPSSTSTSTRAILQGMSLGSTTVRVSASAGRCTATGSGSPTVQPCTDPTGETTASYGPAPDANDIYVSYFLMTLQGPTGASWAGETVQEANYAPGSDSCYFSGSSIPPQTSVTGSAWKVGSGQGIPVSAKQWGADAIGPSNNTGKYYQLNAPSHGGLPCGSTIYQAMEITCQGQTSVYQQNVLSYSIAAGGVTDCRAGQCNTRLNQ